MDSRERARTEAGPAVFSPLERAEQWFFKSGIYVSDQGARNYGAVFSEYDPKRARHDLVYAEATGYVLSFFKYLSSNGRRPSMDQARASGDWLVRWSRGQHGIIAFGEVDDRLRPDAYAFDNGICCKGLLDLHELTGDLGYLRCAENIAEWLMNDVVNSDGSVKPIFHLDSRKFEESPEVWYGVSGSFHAKIAMALLQLHSINGKQEPRETALRIMAWTLGQQRPDGSFPANSRAKFVFMHPHCYTVEALLYAYAYERDPKLLEAAERAIQWMVRVQLPGGHFPRWHGNGWFKGKASDAQAQAVRLLSLSKMLDSQAAIEPAIQRAVASLIGMQSRSEDPREQGGFYEGEMRRYRLFPTMSTRMTSWSAMFAIHALSLRTKAREDFFCEAKHLF